MHRKIEQTCFQNYANNILNITTIFMAIFLFEMRISFRMLRKNIIVLKHDFFKLQIFLFVFIIRIFAVNLLSVVNN